MLTTSEIPSLFAEGMRDVAPELAGARWIAVDAVPERARVRGAYYYRERPYLSTPTADVAFLQYTSGSTGAPRGVMVSHGNLLANSG